jgi:hypothetical protein
MAEFLVQLIPIFLIQLVSAVVCYKFAPRLGANKYLWTAVTIIPIFGLFFMYYVGYRIVAHILDRINFLSVNYKS